MAVPDYQSLMLPLLKMASDGKKHSISEAVEFSAIEFKLSDKDLREPLPSGRQFKFKNRVGWARTYLKKAGLLISPERGYFQITKLGLELIKSKPNKIDSKLLNQYPMFRDFRKKKKSKETVSAISNSDNNKSPDELLEESYAQLSEGLVSELLEMIKSCSPSFFEKLVIDLLIKMGYGGSRKDAGKAIGCSGDGGIDGIIKEDKLGLDVIYIQAKRWENTVGRPTVQAFAGSLEGVRAKRGIIITTSRYSKDALSYIENIEKKIVLIDGEQLARLMIDYNVGVGPIAKYEIKKMDTDYFIED